MTIALAMLGWCLVALVVGCKLGRAIATRRRYEEIWRAIEARRRGDRLTPAHRAAVRAAQQRQRVPQ